MKKIVINRCFGGFSLSEEAIKHYAQLKGLTAVLSYHDLARDDPHLVATVEALGEAANGRLAELQVVAIPDNITWYIHDYDGLEHIAENHRTWP